MRIHRIRLRNYRGIVDREVELAPVGVTVIEGPNEIGKSSIVESLNFLFEELDSTAKQAVKDTKPVSRDAGPEVEVELETGPYTLTYRKRFLRDRETVLQVTKPRAESLTGREAHERVREILDETLDESLWKALRITQGEEVGEVVLGGIGSLSSALDAEAGTTPAGLQEMALYDRARTEYLSYWTANGRAKAEASTLRDGLADREAELRAIEAALKDLEDDVDQVAQLNAEKDRLDQRRTDDEKRAIDLRAQWRKVEGMQKHVETLEAKGKAARLEAERAHKASADRDALIEKVATGRDECDRLRLAMEEAAPVLESATERAAAATSGLGESRQLRHAVERSAKLLRGDVEHLRDEQTLATLGEHRVQLVEERKALIASEATLETNKVDEAALQSIREASTEAQMARARLEAGSPSVDIESLGADGLELDGKAITIEPGTTEHRSVIGQLRVEVPGSIRVDVSAGADGTNLTEALTEAESVLATACEAVGVKDLAEAQTLATARRDAEAARQERGGTIQSILKALSLKSPDELVTGITTIEHRVDEYAKGRPSEPAMPSDEPTARTALTEAEGRLEEAQAAEEHAEVENGAAQKKLGKLETTATEDGVRLQVATEAQDSAERALDKARVESPDEDLVERRRENDAALRQSTADVADARVELKAEGPEGMATLLENAEAVLVGTSRELRRVEDKLLEVQTRLRDHQEDGLSEKRDAGIVERDAAERRSAAYQRRAHAHKLLFETLRSARESAHRAYIGPLRARIESLGRVIYGETLQVELTEDLRIASRTVDGETVPFRSLSIGTKEQLGVIARLACATIVAEDGGAPLLLDDALGFSDPNRLEAMGAVLGLAAGSCQIIALTCYPDRYRHIGGATIRRLE